MASNAPCRLLQIIAGSYRASDDVVIWQTGTAFLFSAQNWKVSYFRAYQS